MNVTFRRSKLLRRRGGDASNALRQVRRYVAPDVASACPRLLRWYVCLINIADRHEDASRNRLAPVEYTVEQLRAILVSVSADARYDGRARAADCRSPSAITPIIVSAVQSAPATAEP